MQRSSMGRKFVKQEVDTPGCSSRRNARPVARRTNSTCSVTHSQAVRPMDRQLMRPWLINQIDSKEINGLAWMNRECTLVKIPWKHGSRHGWKVNKDACLFKRWAMHTGKFSEHDTNPKRWKANFRCAINSLPDVQEEKNLGQSKGHQAFKVYRLLEEKKRKKDIKLEVNETPTKVERRKRCMDELEEEEDDDDIKQEDYYPTKKSRCEKLKNQKRKMISRRKQQQEISSLALSKEEPKDTMNSIKHEKPVEIEESHCAIEQSEPVQPHSDHDYHGGVPEINTDSQLCATPVAPNYADNTVSSDIPSDAASPHTLTSSAGKAVVYRKIGSGGCVVFQSPYTTDPAALSDNGSVVVQSTYPQDVLGITHESFTSLIETADHRHRDEDDASVITDDNIADYIDNMEYEEARRNCDSGISSPQSTSSSLDSCSPPWSPEQSPEDPTRTDAGYSTSSNNWDTFKLLTSCDSRLALSFDTANVPFKIPVPNFTVTVDSSDDQIMNSDPAMPTPLASAPTTPDVFTDLLPPLS